MPKTSSAPTNQLIDQVNQPKHQDLVQVHGRWFVAKQFLSRVVV